MLFHKSIKGIRLFHAVDIHERQCLGQKILCPLTVIGKLCLIIGQIHFAMLVVAYDALSGEGGGTA